MARNAPAGKPKTGETLWYLIPRVNTDWLNLVDRQLKIDAGVSNQKAVRPRVFLRR